ncbi:MAG TPA: hypothetical protein G4N92_07870 [Anaerolineae bacterium]|nr:hypothetical protein [Anaerolineae bacterium]
MSYVAGDEIFDRRARMPALQIYCFTPPYGYVTPPYGDLYETPCGRIYDASFGRREAHPCGGACLQHASRPQISALNLPFVPK